MYPRTNMNRPGALLWISVVSALAGSAALGCGGGDDGGEPTTVPPQILSEDTYAQRCVSVRTGTAP